LELVQANTGKKQSLGIDFYRSNKFPTPNITTISQQSTVNASTLLSMMDPDPLPIQQCIKHFFPATQS